MTLPQMLAKLRRRGVTFGVVDGFVRVDGWRLLSTEREGAVPQDRDNVKARLEARDLRRQRRAGPQAEAEQHRVAEPTPQRSRRVIGLVVNPGGPLRLLYADEVTEIDVRRARVVGVIDWGLR